MSCLPSRPGRGAETTLLCTGRPFRQWLQAGGDGADNAASADAEFPGDVVSDVNVPCPALVNRVCCHCGSLCASNDLQLWVTPVVAATPEAGHASPRTTRTAPAAAGPPPGTAPP